MIYLIMYDITDDKNRTKIAKALVKAGYERIQYSVFTGLEDPKKDIVLWETLNKYCKAEDTEKAVLAIVKVPTHYFMATETIGQLPKELTYLAGLEHTMIF